MPPKPLVVVATEESELVKQVRKVSAEHWAKEAKEAETKKSSASTGWAVSDETPSSVETMLESFLSAAETPVIEKVVWLPSVPSNHPLRKIDLFVTLWEPEEWNCFFSFVKGLEKEPDSSSVLQDAFEKRFWFVIAASTTDSKGKRVFTSAALTSPKIQDDTVVEALMRKFDSPKYRPAMSSIFQAAMILNGLHNPVENRDGKKSEETADTESSAA